MRRCGTSAEKRKARKSRVGTESLSFEMLAWMREVRCVKSGSSVDGGDNSV